MSLWRGDEAEQIAFERRRATSYAIPVDPEFWETDPVTARTYALELREVLEEAFSGVTFPLASREGQWATGDPGLIAAIAALEQDLCGERAGEITLAEGSAALN